MLRLFPFYFSFIYSFFFAAIDTLVCVAGGWVGGAISDDDIFTKTEKMWSMNVQSAIASSHVASKLLTDGNFHLIFLYYILFVAVLFCEPSGMVMNWFVVYV
jgi:hypothetical protein